MDEESVLVQFDSNGITATFPEGKVSSIAWSDVCTVAIETNDSGPWGFDFWWLLEGVSTRCAFPQGATGELEAVDEIRRRFTPFREEEFLNAVTSVDNARFVCWG